MREETKLTDMLDAHPDYADKVSLSQGFWESYLGDFEQGMKIPKQKNVQAISTGGFGKVDIEFNHKITQEIFNLCREADIALSTFLNTIWGIIIQRYTNTSDILFGRIDNFSLEKKDFYNQVRPLRVKIKEGETFLEMSQRLNVDKRVCDKYEVSKNLWKEYKDDSTLFVCEDIEEKYDLTKHISTFDHNDFNLLIHAKISEIIVLEFVFNPHSYSDFFMNQMKGHFTYLVLQLLNDVKIPVGKLRLLADFEESELLNFNNTNVPFPKQKSICDLFRCQVENNPNKVALVFGNSKMSYKELNLESDKLANVLVNKGVSPGSNIGLMIDRSMNMIISILGILKAGAAYVPIDPQYPLERIEYMLSDSQAELLLVGENYLNLCTNLGIQTEIVDYLLQEDVNCQTKLPIVDPSSISYIIYTSGSTGNPKGILTSHCNIVKTVINCGYITLNTEDKVLQLSNYVFDGSTFDIFGALLNGAELVLVPKEVILDPLKLTELISKEKITVTFITTALFNLLIDIDISCFNGIRKILFGGENASVKHIQHAYNYLGKDRIIHVYGPTEATVFSTYYCVDESINEMDVVPIGKPINNTNIFILNQENSLQPIGIIGEICISGPGLAKGYLNREELTEKVFVNNPFFPGEKMYRTGDLALWRENGEIEFINRIDSQVKIRGHRIELGEIEKHLLHYGNLKEAIVLVKKDDLGHSVLCAYYITNVAISSVEIKRLLSKKIPEYMIPDYFIEVNNMPLTLNGKIDRKSLPSPFDINTNDIRKDPPRGETEKKLHGIWEGIFSFNNIGRDDSFFALGGQSLKAMFLISKIQKEFKVSIPLNEIFIRPTISKIAQYIDLHSNSRNNNIPPLEKSDIKDYYPVSFPQKGIYTVQKLDESNCSYNVTNAYRIKGILNKGKLENVFRKLIQRHESFRTSFHFIGGEIVQKIDNNVTLNIEEIPKKDNSLVSDYVESFIKPFDLSKAPLLRVGLMELAENDFLLVIDSHHIILDGVSLGILNNEINRMYNEIELVENPLQYRDYTLWNEKNIASPLLGKQKEFWKKNLEGEIPLLNLPTDYQRPPIQSFKGNKLHFSVGEDLSNDLRRESDAQGTTIFMYLAAVYHIFLSKIADQDDIIIGTPVAGRTHPDLTSIIGMFVNTIPLRNKSNPNQSFHEFLLTVKEVVLHSLSNSSYPFEKIVGDLDEERDSSRNPIFDTMLILQNMELESPKFGEADVQQLKLESQYSRFDLSWEFYENKELDFCIEFSSILFKSSTIERMAEQFIYVLKQVVNNNVIKISDIDLVNDIQKEQLLVKFNDTETDYPSELTVHQLFENQVSKTPDNVAVKYGNSQITYSELNQRANSLAKKLRYEFGVQRDQFIGIMMEKSIDLVVAVIAVLKSGAAYIPIDPTYPLNRIKYMLNDSELKYLIVDEESEISSSFRGNVIKIDSSENLDLTENLINVNDVSDLAYMIYTSGSTGNPKGVMIEHQGLVNFSLVAKDFGITEGGKVLQFASFSFDASVCEIFHTLLLGATLYIENTNKIISNIIPWIKDNKITSVILPPSLLRSVNYMELPDLKTIVTAGEECSKELVKTWGKGRRFINAYGPTEATIGSTLGILTEKDETITIGKPIYNKKIYILNQFHKLQPIGVPGELYIGGIGLARGYWNRSEMTSERFIDNPFEPGEKMYKTGDIARWLDNGQIEFLGRIDYQVKINGHRIELEEIQEQLLQHRDVTEAVVINWADKGNTNLCAYVSLKDKTLQVDLKPYLKSFFPDYMIPSQIITVESLPLTSNGKIDRKALPKPEVKSDLNKKCIKPRNKIESLLVEIWEEVLNCEKVSIDDEFLSLGGDSIKGIQIAAKMNLHGFKVEIRHFYEYPTIALIAPYVKEIERIPEQGIISGTVKLTPIQNWFFAQGYSDENHWNQSILIASDDSWNPLFVEQAFNKLTQHHDALRMRYRKDNDKVIQVNQDWVPNGFVLEIFEIENENEHELINREASLLQQQMNIEQGDLIKIAIFKTVKKDYLFIAIHHLVIDGVSWRILLDDFNNLYGQLKSGLNLTLPMKTDSYMAWSKTLQDYISTDSFIKESEYWDSVESVDLPILPKDKVSVLDCTMSDSKVVHITLPKKESKELISKANEAYNTEVNDILLSALVITMKKQMEVEVIGINLEGHGREEMLGDINLSRTIGWFTSIFPVIFSVSSDKVEDVIKSVKEKLRSIPMKGIGFGIKKYLQDTIVEKESIKPEISFNYLGVFDEGYALDGISESSISIGDSISPLTKMSSSLEINGVMTNGQLQFAFRYNPNVYYDTTICKLVETYRATLLEINKHCIELNKQVKTKSDFSATEIEQDELDRFFESLGN